jgi:hypothetical protein
VDAVCRARNRKSRVAPKSGMDTLVTGLAPLIALGLERYYQEGYERG